MVKVPQLLASPPSRSYSLEEEPYEKLRQAMRIRLEGKTSLGPTIDPRRPTPQRWLIEELEQGSNNLKERMRRVLSEFLWEIRDPEIWPEPARRNLTHLLHYAGPEMGAEVFRFTGGIEPKTNDERALLASLLKVCVSLGQKSIEPFWLEQRRKLGPEYGAVVLRGLVEHGVGRALKFLPELYEDERARESIDRLMVVLVRRYGYSKIRAALLRPVPTPEVRDLIENLEELGPLGPESDHEVGGVAGSVRKLAFASLYS